MGLISFCNLFRIDFWCGHGLIFVIIKHGLRFIRIIFVDKKFFENCCRGAIMEDYIFWRFVEKGNMSRINILDTYYFPRQDDGDYSYLIAEMEYYCEKHNLPPEHILRRALTKLTTDNESEYIANVIHHWYETDKKIRIQNSRRVSPELLAEQGLTPHLLKSFKIEPEADGLYNLVKIQIRRRTDTYFYLALSNSQENIYWEKYCEELRPVIEEQIEEYEREQVEFVRAINRNCKKESVPMLRPRAEELVQEGKAEWKENETGDDYIELKGINYLPDAEVFAHSAEVSKLYKLQKDKKEGGLIAVFISPITPAKWNALQSIPKLAKKRFVIKFLKCRSYYEDHREILKSQPRNWEEYVKIYNYRTNYPAYDNFFESFIDDLRHNSDYYEFFWL